MKPIWAIVPLKPAGSGKSRLAAGIGTTERTTLMRCMAADVLQALHDCPRLAGVVILGNGEPAASLAREFSCRLLADDASGNLCANLDRAAVRLAAEGAGTLLILPADLPGLSGSDIGSLLDAHRGGVTVAVAARDGGSNALLLTPPSAIPTRFGPDSAARHIAAAEAQGLQATALDLPAFAQDIDTADDVRALCSQTGHGATYRYLLTSGICARLRNPHQT